MTIRGYSTRTEFEGKFKSLPRDMARRSSDLLFVMFMLFRDILSSAAIDGDVKARSLRFISSNVARISGGAFGCRVDLADMRERMRARAATSSATVPEVYEKLVAAAGRPLQLYARTIFAYMTELDQPFISGARAGQARP